MSRWSLTDSTLPLLALLFALGLLVVPLSAGGDTHTEGIEDGETEFVVELDTSGDAHWQLTERIPLVDESAEVAFASVAEAFEAGEYDLTAPDRIETAARAVDESTERSMTVTDPNRTSAIEGDGDNRTGTLTVSFTWENFARMAADGDELYVDDVLETEQGLWLPGLTDDQKLVVRAPDGYAVLDASVPPQNGSLHWDGPATFDRETLAATFTGNGGDTDTDTDTDDTNGTDETDDDDDGDSTGLFPLLLVGVLVVAVAAVLAVSRDRLGDLLAGDPAPGEPDDSATDGGGAATAAVDESGSADAEAEATTTTGDGASPVGGQTDTDDTDDGIDEELLSDEERVERLLEHNGGRMKQADIVDETGWSNAKVSQLLSAMADEDRVDKLRIGRENLISFPDVDVTDSDRDS
jgi:hypothetical protein